MSTHRGLDQIWLVITPHNPHKNKASLAKDFDRLHLVRISIEGNSALRASDIEFNLPKPSYTIDTLAFLKERYPDDNFALIMGGDNVASLPKWKNYQAILADHDIYVYQRPSYDLGELAGHPRIKIVEAPLLDISSSYIRKRIKQKESIRYLVRDEVFDYIDGSNMYQ
ncbi:UNVERIFIED_CONTAM: hypothetical protein GTU68_053287 [Idotea baltica]|nr:hypothetical protein [Idotea baltica]